MWGIFVARFPNREFVQEVVAQISSPQSELAMQTMKESYVFDESTLSLNLSLAHEVSRPSESLRQRSKPKYIDNGIFYFSVDKNIFSVYNTN